MLLTYEGGLGHIARMYSSSKSASAAPLFSDVVLRVRTELFQRAEAMGVPFLSVFALPAWVAAGMYWGGPAWLGAPINFLILHPIADHLMQKDPVVPEAPTRAANSWVPTAALVAYPLVHLARVLATVWRAPQVTGWELWAMAGALGSMGGLSMTISHELVHRRNRALKGLGIALLLSCTYPQFFVEHIYGHHKNVGTPKDSATALRGESLYRFLIRGPKFGLINAFQLKPTWMIALSVTQVAIYAAIFAAFGWAGVAVMAVQSALAILTLEVANYIEHYGLERKEISKGVYEPVTPMHSWDSHHFLSNASLYNLGLHAEHHARPAIEYQKLQPNRDGRVFPYGFTAMLLLATVPPLWFRVMNPLLPELDDARRS